ncbi:V-type ATP synthase subunit K [Candidatus Omnitrophus magneticus]|uniref:V-type ATP synthase subunit K n=1 Tax=Candidatus Omnitrophus magneticus TaxID=1609969 RepID=A0A0F0CMK5_9BACT|nr:V-type ATP synthase subunit K [Candidatus Omnitrophus magneticus]
MVSGLGDMGLSLAFSAIGSAFGAGAAGMSAIGAWKKLYMKNKIAPFILVAFVGAPLSQTIYGMILRNAIKAANIAPEAYPYVMILGMASGIAIGFSAWFQGKAGACAADALAETGQGFGNYMMVLGILETVALFVMVFVLTSLPKV